MPALQLAFSNKTTLSADDIYIGFVPGASGNTFSITNASGGALLPLNTGSHVYPFAGNWYTLSALSEGVRISHFSGRIYVAYQTPWQVQREAYEPAQAVVDPNFYLRYDKMEITFNGASTDVANLTSIDYWSIPLTLQTSMNDKAVETVAGLLNGTTAQDIYNVLNALTTPPVSGIAGPGGTDGTPLPALVPGAFQQYGTGPAPLTTFARIIGPSSYPPVGAIPVMPYDTFKGYLQYLADSSNDSSTIATIAGTFAGVGPNVPASGPQSRQQYQLNATIDANLDITLSGTIADGDQEVSMLYKAADLMNPTGIYGGNAPFSLTENGTTTFQYPGNDVFGWIGGDLFSGLNIGAVGSQAPSGEGATTVGQLQSSQWFKLPVSSLYSGLQPDNAYYNQWAAALQSLSQAYNFAYTDRFAPVFASLDPASVDTLTLVLEPGDVQM